MSKANCILSINAGSSSLKITLFAVKGKALEKIAATAVSGFTAPPAKETQSWRGRSDQTRELPDIKSHNDAFQHILQTFLEDKDLTEVAGKDDIAHACHRVVHGGDFAEDQLIDENTYHKIEELEDLAPL